MKSKEELKKSNPELYRVAMKGETEPPFTGKFYASKEKGMYACAVCGNELFSSDTKFDSGTGWPSFYKPKSEDGIEYVEDNTYGMKRTEVKCKKCGAHLGHVFDDLPRRSEAKAGGPPPGARRYCINSVCLELEKKEN